MGDNYGHPIIDILIRILGLFIITKMESLEDRGCNYYPTFSISLQEIDINKQDKFGVANF